MATSAQPIEVPRDTKDSDKKVSRDVEDYLLDILSENPLEPFTFKELLGMIRDKYQSIYGWDLEGHVSWALDMLHANSLIKRVAPSTYEAPEGPDDVYSERATGHAPEGEFVHRGKDFTKADTSHFKSKAEYNHELGKADWSVKMLKNMGKNEEDIETMLLAGDHPYNRVALKVAIKKHFHGTEI
jgi:hypothetical protein